MNYTIAVKFQAVSRVAVLAVGALLVFACTSSHRELPARTATSRIPTMVLHPSDTVETIMPVTGPTTRPELTVTPPPSSIPQASPTADQPGMLAGSTLVAALREGGYVIYLRHAATDRSQVDSETQNLQDCSKQRNLNEQGRVQARAIGESFIALNIPVGLVLSSAYCRARDTALLAFGQAEITLDLTGFPDELREERVAALQQMLSTPPEPGTNTVLVAHGFNITNTANITLIEGEAAIFTPLGEDGFALVARVRPDDWIRLERLVIDSLLAGLGNDPGLLLPDLVTLPPSQFGIRSHSVTGVRTLRFTNSIQNNGPGAIEIWGYSDSTSEKTIVVQTIDTADGSPPWHVVAGEFIFHPEHDHWHVEGFARYDLWSLDTHGDLDAMVAVSEKVSYCLRDDARAELQDAPRVQTYTLCDQKRQGISAGWIDVYEYYLPGQDLDITDVPDGIYALRSIVDPANQFRELSRSNNAVIVYLEISGNRVNVVDTAGLLNK